MVVAGLGLDIRVLLPGGLPGIFVTGGATAFCGYR